MIPLNSQSHFSLLSGLSSPKDLVLRSKELGLEYCCLNDINNMSGCVEFYIEAKKAGIKPILGTRLFVECGHITLIAKNFDGYKELLKITSRANSKNNYRKHAYISLEEISSFNLDNIICITGYSESSIYNKMVLYEELIEKPDIKGHIEDLKRLFKNLYIENNISEYTGIQKEVKSIILDIAKEYSIDVIATPRVLYSKKEEQIDHWVLLAIKNKNTINFLKEAISENFQYFHSNKFTFLDREDYRGYEYYLKNNAAILSQIEDYDILSGPKLPKLAGDSDKELRSLCENNWHKIDKRKEQEYKDRLNKELAVLKEARLADYFLIVKKIIDYAKSIPSLVGPGRGSVGGCLVAYLCGLTQIDPIKHDLIFERFYNAGRASEGRISLPDIDTDFEPRHRENIINFIKKEFGNDKVSQMSTYGTLMGRAALKAVFRAHGSMSFTEMNNITEFIYDKAKISEQLQEMKDEGREPSVIRWCLENRPDKFMDYCWYGDEEGNDNLEGPLAAQFEQAIRLEKTKITQSKHAAGVLVASEPLENFIPMIYDEKENTQISGPEMNEVEAVGGLKLDILGLGTLSCMQDINNF